MTKTGLLLAGIVVALAASVRADESIRFLGTVAVSPDGKTMVFSWRDDLWSASVAGGNARRLTFHPGRESDPVFSPDGKQLAFTSNRTGSEQVYVMPAAGGSPRRLTTDTNGSSAVGWYPGDRGLLIAATQDHFWRRAERLFFKKMELAAKPVLLFDDYARDAELSPDGRHVAFTREGTSWWRKQYRGSQASQIWTYDTAGRTFKKLTDGDHEERWPMWTPDGKALIYVSQSDGTNNLYRRDLETGNVEQLTRYVDDGVLFPTMARDGSVIVFRWMFDHYRFDPNTRAAPERIDLRYAGDPLQEPVMRENLTRASAAAFSDDGREVVFAAGGDLWVMDTELREPVRLTNTPEEERDPVFAPDYSAILYVSDAGGRCDVWRAVRKNKRKAWWENTEFESKPVTSDEAVESGLRFVPGGRVAFIRGRGDLVTMKSDGTDQKTVIASWNAPSYSFSPCGFWVAYALSDGDFNRDIWIRRADGSDKPFNVSRHPDNETNPVWSPDGKILAFVGERNHDERDIHYVWVQKKGDEETDRDRKLDKARKKMKGRRPPNAERQGPRRRPQRGAQKGAIERVLEALMPKAKPAPKKKAERRPTRIDFEGIEDRIRRIRLPNTSEGGLLFSPDSKKLAFRASIDGRAGLYTISIPENPKPVFLASRPGTGARWLKEGNQIVWLVGGVPASTSARGKTTAYSFRVAHETDIGARNRAAFDVAWRVMRDAWYDDKHNNRDWNAVRAKYRAMAGETRTDTELRQVVSMMLGELNGSHLGFWTSRRGGFSPPGWRHVTAHTGARFEASFAGPGLRVRDVVKGTPAAQNRSRLNPGDIVLSVNGRNIEPGVDPAIYFTGEPGREMTLAGARAGWHRSTRRPAADVGGRRASQPVRPLGPSQPRDRREGFEGHGRIPARARHELAELRAFRGRAVQGRARQESADHRRA